jgi:hypothetical protein
MKYLDFQSQNAANSCRPKHRLNEQALMLKSTRDSDKAACIDRLFSLPKTMSALVAFIEEDPLQSGSDAQDGLLHEGD